jgi:hypothetical protein
MRIFHILLFNPLNAKTLIVYNVTLPYIPERNDKASPHVACFHDVHAHAYFQCFKGIWQIVCKCNDNSQVTYVLRKG